MWYFFLFLLVAVPAVIVWTERRKQRLLDEPQVLNLVGCIGEADEAMKQGQAARVQVSDHNGDTHTITARLEDAPESVEPGHELLVIDNPGKDGVVVVVPARDIPRLEEES